MTTLSYESWDKMVDEEEDEEDGEAAAAAAASARSRRQLQRTLAALMSAAQPPVADDDAARVQVLAHFLAEQDAPAESACNIPSRCDAILGVLSRFPRLLREDDGIRALRDFYARLVQQHGRGEAPASSTGHRSEGKVVLRGLNTLLAIRAAGGPNELFGRVCGPRSDADRELREK